MCQLASLFRTTFLVAVYTVFGGISVVDGRLEFGMFAACLREAKLEPQENAAFSSILCWMDGRPRAEDAGSQGHQYRGIQYCWHSWCRPSSQAMPCLGPLLQFFSAVTMGVCELSHRRFQELCHVLLSMQKVAPSLDHLRRYLPLPAAFKFMC